MATASLNEGFGFEGDDRISHLPCDIMCNILSKLPLRDAVRTSILSREWRRKWVTISHLVFDREFKQSLRGIRDLESIIDRVLTLHEGPLVKFTLKDINIKGHPCICHWLHLLSNQRLEELTLRFLYSRTYHAMPSILFSFDRITHLYLANCDIRPPVDFKGFHRLVRLDLVSVRFPLGDFKTFLSKCPMLEFLNMRSFNGNSISHLDICAPKLKSFYFWGKFSSICFGNASLEELSICYADFVLSEEGILVEDFDMPKSQGSGLNLIKGFVQLSSVKRLEYNNRFLQFLAFGGVPEKLPNNLDYLTLIQLSDIDFGNIDEVSCALCLIRSSPNLQSLEITSETSDDSIPEAAAIQYLKTLQKRGVPLSRCLKNVKIEWFSGVEPEIEFIKLFLSAATDLQKLEVKSAYHGTTDEQGSTKMLEKLTSFRPSKSEAVILVD